MADSSTTGSNGSASTSETHEQGDGSMATFSIAMPPITPQQARTSYEEEDSSKKPKIPWTPEEDEILRRAVELYKGRAWKQVAELLPGRTHSQAAHRWQKVLDPKLKKGAWTQEEDDMLQQAVDEMGEGHWSRVAERVGSRNGKQCRERWRNQISPDVDKRPWLPEEDEGIIRIFGELGPKWAEIAKHFPGRTENAVKNRWNAKLGRPHGSAASSPSTPNASARKPTKERSTTNGDSAKSKPASSKRGSRNRENGHATNASPTSPTQPPRMSAFSLSTPLALTGPASVLATHLATPTSPPPFMGGVPVLKAETAIKSAFASANGTSKAAELPPLGGRKKQKTSTDNQQMDATAALLALKTGSSPGW